jgi:hypothetical protein
VIKCSFVAQEHMHILIMLLKCIQFKLGSDYFMDHAHAPGTLDHSCGSPTRISWEILVRTCEWGNVEYDNPGIVWMKWCFSKIVLQVEKKFTRKSETGITPHKFFQWNRNQDGWMKCFVNSHSTYTAAFVGVIWQRIRRQQKPDHNLNLNVEKLKRVHCHHLRFQFLDIWPWNMMSGKGKQILSEKREVVV